MTFKRRHCSSIAIFLLAFAVAPVSAAAEGNALPAMTLRQVLPELRQSSPATRRIFVEVAVAVLSDRFLAAAGESADDAGWARNTRAYVADLWRAVDAVRAGGTVSVLEEHDGSLRVVVAGAAGYQFALMPPKPEQRAAVETEIAAQLCRSMDCSTIEHALLAAAVPPGAPTPATGSHAVVARLVDQQSGGDGLSCVAAGVHSRLHVTACARLLAEVRALVKALHQHAVSGQPLEWGMLMQPIWRQRGRELVVAGDGTVIFVETPLLGRYSQIVVELVPWMRARVGGTVREQTLKPPPGLIYRAGRPGNGSEQE